MGFLSQHLVNYVNSPQTSERAPVKVVVRLSQAPTMTLDRVPAGAQARSLALEALRDTGMGGNILLSAGLRPRRIIQGVNSVTVQVAGGELEQLADAPGVEYVRPVRMHTRHLNGSVALLGVDAGVRARYDGTGVRVAVIDSGIDHEHPDLQGRVNLKLSRNFTNEGSETDVSDGHGHGTHVAGIIGGAGATYRGVAPNVEFIACKVFTSSGAATEEGAVIAAVRWAMEQGANVINYSGGYQPTQFIPGIGVIAQVAPPWVWPADLMDEEAEFKRAMDSGVVAVVSAGNNGELGRRGTLSMPATSPAVISVAAVDKQRRLSGFSSVGPVYRSPSVSQADMVSTLTPALRANARTIREPDLIAPGGELDVQAGESGGCVFLPGIISAASTQAAEDEDCSVEDGYRRMSGTSQAAPHVAGLAALVLHAARELDIDLGARRGYAVKGILRAAAQRLVDFRPAEQGRGLPRWSDIEGLLEDIAAGRTHVSRFTR